MEVVDRNIQVYLEFERRLRPKIRALLTRRADRRARGRPARPPLGRPAARASNYFRRQPQPGKYILVATKPWEEYRIAMLSGGAARWPRCSATRRFASEEAGLHGIFLRRVRRPAGGRLMADRSAPPRSTATPTGSRWLPARRSSSRSRATSPGTLSRRPRAPRSTATRTRPAPASRRRRSRARSTAPTRAGTSPIRSGSHVIVDDQDGALALTGAFTLHAFVLPTTPGKDGQVHPRPRAPPRAAPATRSTIEGGRLHAADRRRIE